LPDRVLGSRFTTVATLKQATGPILSRKGLDQFSDDLTTGTLHTCFKHDKTQRNLPLERVRCSHHSTFGHIRMGGKHLLNCASGQTMPSDVDDVIRPTHDQEITILILVTGISGQVIARIGAQIGLLETSIIIPQRRQTTRWQGKLNNNVAGLTGWCLSR